MATQLDQRPIDSEKSEAFLMKMIADIGATITGASVIVGDKLGLYKTLNERGPMTSVELAAATGTHERYVREWLANQDGKRLSRIQCRRENLHLTA